MTEFRSFNREKFLLYWMLAGHIDFCRPAIFSYGVVLPAVVVTPQTNVTIVACPEHLVSRYRINV